MNEENFKKQNMTRYNKIGQFLDKSIPTDL